jgi:hypothetical protein
VTSALGEEGSSLAELIVGMAVISVCGAIFSAGMMEFNASSDANDSLTSAQAQTDSAFERLDKEIRYATGISAPAHVNTSWYVEYASNPDRCTQLRMTDTSGLLQSRTQTGTGAISGWRQLASQLSGARGFIRTAAADSAARNQQLSVTFTLTTGSRWAKASRPVSFTFTALNTSPDTADAVCGGMGRP